MGQSGDNRRFVYSVFGRFITWLSRLYSYPQAARKKERKGRAAAKVFLGLIISFPLIFMPVCAFRQMRFLASLPETVRFFRDINIGIYWQVSYGAYHLSPHSAMPVSLGNGENCDILWAAMPKQPEEKR